MPNIPVSPNSCCHTQDQCPSYTLHPTVPNKRNSPLFEENFNDLAEVEDVLEGSFSQIFPSTWSNINVSAGVLDFTILPTSYWHNIHSTGFRRASQYDITKARVYSFDLRLTDPVNTVTTFSFQQITVETALCGPITITQNPPNPPIPGAIEKPTRILGIQFFRTSPSEIYFNFLDEYNFNTLNGLIPFWVSFVVDSGIGDYNLTCLEDDFFNLELIIYSPEYEDFNIFTYVYTDISINSVYLSTIRATISPYYLGTPFNSFQKAEIDSCLGIMDFRRCGFTATSGGANKNRLYVDKISCVYL